MSKVNQINERQLEQLCINLSESILDLLDQKPQLNISSAGASLRKKAQKLISCKNQKVMEDEFIKLVGAIKKLVTAYHEAGHTVAYYYLAPKEYFKIIDVVYKGHRINSEFEAGVRFEVDGVWPNEEIPSEILADVACVLAGQLSMPKLKAGLEIVGSAQEDDERIKLLISVLPESMQASAIEEAKKLLENIKLVEVADRLAPIIYSDWNKGHSSAPFERLERYLEELD